MVPAMASAHLESSRTETEHQRQGRLAREADAVAATEPDVAADRHRRTLRALADIDAGRLIDDAAMKTWADSLGTDQEIPAPDPD